MLQASAATLNPLESWSGRLKRPFGRLWPRTASGTLSLYPRSIGLSVVSQLHQSLLAGAAGAPWPTDERCFDIRWSHAVMGAYFGAPHVRMPETTWSALMLWKNAMLCKRRRNMLCRVSLQRAVLCCMEARHTPHQRCGGVERVACNVQRPTYNTHSDSWHAARGARCLARSTAALHNRHVFTEYNDAARFTEERGAVLTDQAHRVHWDTRGLSASAADSNTPRAACPHAAPQRTNDSTTNREEKD